MDIKCYDKKTRTKHRIGTIVFSVIMFLIIWLPTIFLGIPKNSLWVFICMSIFMCFYIWYNWNYIDDSPAGSPWI